MDFCKERNRSPRSLDGSKGDSNISASNNENIMTFSYDRSSASEFKMEYQYDDLASLEFTDSDDGATNSSDSSDDSYAGRTTEAKRRRPRRMQNQGSDNNDVDNYTNAKPVEHCEVGKYMASREMTPFQERMNALTVLPTVYYIIMFFMSGSWLSNSFVEAYAHEMVDDNEFDRSQCINWSWLPHFHALPPLPPLVVAIGVLGHAPFSMIYHWRYAHRLPPGLPRTTHWSRRMDQAMIHFQSACFSYSTTGRFDFFLVNALFNADCFYRQFLREVRPRRNQIRIGMSIALYTFPLLTRGEFLAYSKLAVLFPLGGWLFGQYPIGGWSHSAFHVAMTFVPPILLATALALSSSQSQLEVAAHCSILAENSFAS